MVGAGPRWRLCLLLGAVLGWGGCLQQGTRRTASIPRAKNVEASAEEIVARNRSLLALYSAEIEAAANTVMGQSASPEVRRQALLWKAEAIPAMQAALFNPDPVAAAVDAWAYLYQMQAYLKQPRFAAAGAWQTVAAAALRHMDSEMEQLVLAIAPGANVADLRRRISDWATAHPLQGGWGGRSSVDAEFVKAVGQSDLGAVASIQALAEGLGNITERLDAYNAYLPKQALWQVELLTSQLRNDPQVAAATASLASASKALDQASSLAGQMPQLAGQARVALRADVDAQRLAAQAFVQDQRLATQDFVARQQAIATADLRAERLATTADLRRERAIVLQALAQYEATALEQARSISRQTVQDFGDQGRALIDHLFWRALQLVLLTLALCWLGAWLLWRRRG